MALLKIQDIINKYGKSSSFWRNNLSRPEFNKFRYRRMEFEYSLEFEYELEMLIEKREKRYKKDSPHG